MCTPEQTKAIVDASEKRTGDRIDSLREDMDKRFLALDKKIDFVEGDTVKKYNEAVVRMTQPDLTESVRKINKWIEQHEEWTIRHEENTKILKEGLFGNEVLKQKGLIDKMDNVCRKMDKLYAMPWVLAGLVSLVGGFLALKMFFDIM